MDIKQIITEMAWWNMANSSVIDLNNMLSLSIEVNAELFQYCFKSVHNLIKLP